MAISPLYIPLFTIEEVILDKDSGLPLSGGVVKFYRDSQRITPKPVYQITGVSPNYTFASVGNELTLGIAGDFVDTDGDPFVPYAYPYDAAGNVDLYYVTVVSEGGVPQFVREAVPYVGTGVIPPSERTNTENELSNSQFVEVLFPSTGSTILSVTGSNTVTHIAPDWDLITSGTGTVTVQRLEPTSANVPTNPPYALRISADAALGASVVLRQRLLNSPSILRGDFVSATLTAAVISGGGTTLDLSYAPSTGTPTTIIPSTNIPTDGAYHTIAGNAAVPQQANDAASTGYIDILITIPTARNIAITSVQIVGVDDSIDIPYDQQTTARQKDHLFNYYEDSILHQPKENLLTGWIFGLNPWQFRTTASSNVANNTYTADQTIIVQQAYVTAATANNVAVARGTNAENFAFVVSAVTAANKFAAIQYIDPSTIRPYWGKILSSLVNITSSTPTHNTAIKFKMRLIYRASLPSTIAQAEPIVSWTNVDSSNPVFAAGWTAIVPLNDPEYTITANTTGNFNFDQFQLPASSNDAMTLGIVIYTTNNMVQTATADRLLFNTVSLVHNDFAIEASSETFDESLRKCQFYYEKSYQVGTLPGTVTGLGQQQSATFVRTTAGVSSELHIQSFFNNFKEVKCVIPTMTFYAPGIATPDRIAVSIFQDGTGVAGTNFTASTSWTNTISANGFQMLSQDTSTVSVSWVNAAASFGDEGIIYYHYTADARLGK